MEGWQIGLVITLAVGVAVILFGVFWDRERNRRRTEQITRPPDRPIPGYAPTADPAYITAPAPPDPPSLELSQQRRLEIRDQLPQARRFAAPLLDGGFVSDPPTGWAVVEHPRILVCAEPVETFHELLEPHERQITRNEALVVVAPALAAEPRATMLVNHNYRTMRLLAVRAEGTLLDVIAEACGATPVSRVDLQADWVPDEVLGTAEVWVSDATASWLIGPSTSRSG